MDYKVKDMKLAPAGQLKIEWAESRMPVMMKLRETYSGKKPLKGVKIGGCLHITKETAVLIKTLRAAGAQVAWCGCNPLSTQDDVAAALAKDGIPVYAWRGLNKEEYYWCIQQVLDMKPNITIDDGADLVFVVHKEHPGLIAKIIGGCEETTTGIIRIRAMANDGMLKYPVIAVSDAETKWDFDNVYGTGQSSIDGIIRATNVMIAGKSFVVAGYGRCGSGVANKARGLGANVIVTEVEPVKALRARMDGFRVMPMDEAAKIGDIFITATGCRDVIVARHFDKMHDGAIVCNTGHFNVEVSVSDIEKLAKSHREVRPNNVEYTQKDGRRIYVLAEGRLVNLSAAEGHPSEIMDMSFANQFMSVLHLSKSKGLLKPDVYAVSREQDKEVAKLKLETMGIKIDKLTPEQEKYLNSWEEGT